MYSKSTCAPAVCDYSRDGIRLESRYHGSSLEPGPGTWDPHAHQQMHDSCFERGHTPSLFYIYLHIETEHATSSSSRTDHTSACEQKTLWEYTIPATPSTPSRGKWPSNRQSRWSRRLLNSSDMEDIFFSAGAPAKRVQDPWYVQWWESIKPFLALPAPKLLSLRDWVRECLHLFSPSIMCHPVITLKEISNGNF